MMQQYLDIKKQYPDTLLMFRLGDFYELFFDDAVTASKALEITLTGRDAGSQGRVPMCGVPYHAVDQYIERLIDQGYCVAICEQLEDPKQTKGLVKRDVVRVVTPGTYAKDEGAGRRVLAVVVLRHSTAGIAFADVSTGDVWFAETGTEQLAELLMQWEPSELVMYDSHVEQLDAQVTDWLERSNIRRTKRPEPRNAIQCAVDKLCAQYKVPSLAPLDLETAQVAAEALGVMLAYIEETQKQHLVHLRNPKSLSNRGHVVVDYTAQRNLELLETARTRQKKGSLFGLLDATRTAMGSRMLRSWIERPLASIEQIEARLDAVSTLVEDVFLRESLREILANVYDLDRLAGKVSFGSANARDLRAIAQSLERVPELASLLDNTGNPLLQQLARDLPDLSWLVGEIDRLLVDQPPLSVREGGLIRPGADAELDELRTLNTSGKEWLANLEQRERERTGIRSLKVGYNKVFGYYIEVSKANTHLVPAEYERRQTLAAAERYTLPELKEQEAKILHAEERALEREYELFCQLREQTLNQLPAIQRTSETLAVVDALVALATVSVQYGYVRPEVTEERGIHIVQGRHPVVEAMSPGTFVPNDVSLGQGADLILITGPNMAGKSTYMRQTALIVLMAHMGCFVPAREARIGRVDRVFTRIGASDDLAGGQSTFMVEMVELAQILRQTTDRSLVLLDEIGRGTSTYDGMSIAEAVMEALLVPGQRPLTLFATHYHELTEKADQLAGAANYSVLVQETEDGISFLHTVVPRPADKSYGIQVARLAGIPEPVIRRAQELLQYREQTEVRQTSGSAAAESAAARESAPDPHLPLFGWRKDALLERLAAVRVETLTPLQAINLLNDYVNEAREVLEWETSESSPKS
jgi:DNA mismatch repair protein MutS